MVSEPPLLLLDTCLLLDVIRAPVRGNVGLHDVQAIRALITRQASQPAQLNFAAVEQVHIEYADIVDDVERETVIALQRQIDQTNETLTMIDAFAIGLSIPKSIQVNAQHVAKSLRAIADGILGTCLSIPHTTDDSHAATQRVLMAKAPATRAKQSLKDCLIVEGILRFVRDRRSVGGLGRAVFASSNTKDYHQGHGTLDPALRAEFDVCGLGFAPSWSAARFEIDRP